LYDAKSKKGAAFLSHLFSSSKNYVAPMGLCFSSSLSTGLRPWLPIFRPYGTLLYRTELKNANFSQEIGAYLNTLYNQS
jgi:hypothetical protein